MREGESKMNRENTLRVLVFALMLVIGLTPLLAQANVHHGTSRSQTAVCPPCGTSGATIRYGCTNEKKLEEPYKTCTAASGCQYTRYQYYTCWRHLSPDGAIEYCHSDRFTYNIHKIDHTICTDKGCVYQ